MNLGVSDLTEIFKIIDTGEQGFITLDQLVLSIYHAAHNPELCNTYELKKTLMKLCPAGHTQKINQLMFVELVSGINRLAQRKIAPETQQIFDIFDPLHTGHLTVNGLIFALTKLRIKSGNLNYQMLFKYIDRNHDGKISPEELQVLLDDLSLGSK